MSAPPYPTAKAKGGPSPSLEGYGMPYHAKVEKNSKGYNWECSVSGDDWEVVLLELSQMEARLKKAYGGSDA